MASMIAKNLFKHNLEENKKVIIDYIKNGDTIYDFGCGDFILFDMIKKQTSKKNLKLIGYDISLLSREIAEKNNYSLKSPKKIKDNSVDIIAMLEVVEHLSFKEFNKIFNELNIKLKKGGLFILSTPNIKCLRMVYEFWAHLEHIRPYPKEGLEYFFKNRGYKLIKYKKVGLMIDPIKIIRSIIMGFELKTNIVLVFKKI
jgi:2-polyprenyl-3-methyl-5-hydroxy-6-metoxy-1,4-benzoquinol methylase